MSEIFVCFKKTSINTPIDSSIAAKPKIKKENEIKKESSNITPYTEAIKYNTTHKISEVINKKKKL